MMGNKNTARFDSDEGHPWDVVMDKADEVSVMLHKKGFSSQDIAHIGLRLTHIGNFMWIVEGTEYKKHPVKRGIKNDKQQNVLRQKSECGGIPWL